MNFVAQSIITSIAFSTFSASSIVLPTTALSTCIPTYPQQAGQNGVYRMALANQSSVVISYDTSCTSTATSSACSQLTLQTFDYHYSNGSFYSPQEGKSSLGFEIATNNDETLARCFTAAMGSSNLELLPCVPNALDQKFNFVCGSCKPGPQFGTACQIRTETDICVTSAGIGNSLYLSGCDVEAKDATQIFNLIT